LRCEAVHGRASKPRKRRWDLSTASPSLGSPGFEAQAQNAFAPQPPMAAQPLADSGRVERQPRYGRSGRPEVEYRWRG